MLKNLVVFILISALLCSCEELKTQKQEKMHEVVVALDISESTLNLIGDKSGKPANEELTGVIMEIAAKLNVKRSENKLYLYRADGYGIEPIVELTGRFSNSALRKMLKGAISVRAGARGVPTFHLIQEAMESFKNPESSKTILLISDLADEDTSPYDKKEIRIKAGNIEPEGFKGFLEKNSNVQFYFLMCNTAYSKDKLYSVSQLPNVKITSMADESIAGFTKGLREFFSSIERN